MNASEQFHAQLPLDTLIFALVNALSMDKSKHKGGIYGLKLAKPSQTGDGGGKKSLQK